MDNFLVCKELSKERALQINLEENLYVENFIDYVEGYFQLKPPDEQKRVREIYDDFNKQGYNRQTTSHQDSFSMCISEHSNGLASAIECKCDKKKQGKRQNNHHFPLRLPQQTKHHSSDSRYNELIWYSINVQWVFGMQLIGGGGKESTKLLGMLNLPW